MKQCNHCNQENNDLALYCINCGDAFMVRDLFGELIPLSEYLTPTELCSDTTEEKSEKVEKKDFTNKNDDDMLIG